MPDVTPETAKYFLDLFVADAATLSVQDINDSFDFLTAEEEDMFAVLQTTLCPN